MKRRSLKSLIYCAVCGLLLSGVPVFAGNHPVRETQAVVRVIDVTLESQGTLIGTVLNGTAQPVAGASVQVMYGDKTVASAVSDASGQFTVTGLRSGTHAVHCAGNQQSVRFWGPDAAPPSSVTRLAVVVDGTTAVRGQTGNGIGNNLIPFAIFGGVLGVTLGTTLGADDPANPPASA